MLLLDEGNQCAKQPTVPMELYLSPQRRAYLKQVARSPSIPLQTTTIVVSSPSPFPYCLVLAKGKIGTENQYPVVLNIFCWGSLFSPAVLELQSLCPTSELNADSDAAVMPWGQQGLRLIGHSCGGHPNSQGHDIRCWCPSPQPM